MSAPDPARRAFLDACVLFPPHLRAVLLTLADAGLYQPLWSERVLAEWALAAARHAESVEDRIAAMSARWPAALAPPGVIEGIDLPDPGDRHVVAAARAGGAGVIVTANLRDFPRRAPAMAGLRAVSPDDFVMDLWLADPGPVERAIATVWPDLTGKPLRAALKRAGLWRLGRALAP